ncbi:MAG: hypothetical protein A2Z91_05050 [Deltaproteobacteria bacterium GWA2_38_16]|nr:MAG: hypothetical protein A2Z91_05050 [Deltaproteobacteria bacterium GWA2_38_16]OGQ03147.1 MAG: hypothetical protein A3D19_03780 [Deltaproteobacteria bacterium RIFCSPHIGHO2_02_FULL_38_15]OGQ34686.1 MAG: hypothetical protein A3A72_07340 [Deltaproteobacteria bacterium RIFCSPLOWO2_01_FULL_38_9]OGQ61764.1 MAG: hypothetical protein A3G92_05205 [Deltaproteobacteria bacterium RIFCSPLOWO2_12_FULL_38_8]HBQ20430.1 hypothetical protein [Deltaproteobacteria bacterium]
MKLTKIITVMVVATAVFLTACGDPTKTKKDESQPGAVMGNNTNQAPINNTTPVFSQRMNGMYDGLGKEFIQQQVYTPVPAFPSFRQWFTRVEFLKEDGSNVDAFSFNPPRNYAKIRLTLVSDVNTAIRYVVEGDVWVNPNYALVGSLRSYNTGNVAFDIEFGSGYGLGPILGLWANDGRLMEGSGTIVLTEPAGQHVIKY